MSQESILYGRITGAHGNTDHWYGFYKANQTVLESLPQEENTYPPLVKQIFSTPEAMAGPTLHRSQVIHFGASFKNIDDTDVRDWIKKFEVLLRQLYWYDAVVHFEVELYGSFYFKWTATDAAVKLMLSNTPQPVNEWTFGEEQ